MPAIHFSLKDLEKLVGRKISLRDLEDFVDYAKAEIDKVSGDDIKVNFDDTNQPYLWSVEGFARLIRGIIGKEKGIPKIKIQASKETIIVNPDLKNIRPYIGAFVAKGGKINEYLLKQIIQLQEKICESYGRKRDKVAIGVYSHKKIKFPVHYKAVAPDAVSFIPLEFDMSMTLKQILEEHPKGKHYAKLLEKFKKYPILVDSNNEVLSFPPIINSNFSGKIEVNDSDLLVEVTGTDIDAVHLAINIFAQAFFDRGFNIYSMKIKYGPKTIVVPHFFNQSVKIKKEDIKNILGIDMSEKEAKALIEKAGFGFSSWNVNVPFYRKDILHPVDIIEELAIMYGYGNIGEEPLKTFTIGKGRPIVEFRNKAREILIGLGYLEIMSLMLTNKSVLYENMNTENTGTVEIEEYMSETYSVVRSWLLPLLMDALSKNKHVEYPQKIFEQGIITKGDLKDYAALAAVSAHNKVNLTEVRQVADSLLTLLGLKYEINETEHSSFISGRVGKIIVGGEEVGFIGELHPEVLKNFEIEMPVAGMEINLTKLFEVKKK